mmetsp:Transcript_15067/g.28679  ORF Transcript_15067/g.28679 Transcript_15067/m.28679 type:complete len:220 (-) Transcript_15067:298-957(-)
MPAIRYLTLISSVACALPNSKLQLWHRGTRTPSGIRRSPRTTPSCGGNAPHGCNSGTPAADLAPVAGKDCTSQRSGNAHTSSWRTRRHRTQARRYRRSPSALRKRRSAPASRTRSHCRCWCRGRARGWLGTRRSTATGLGGVRGVRGRPETQSQPSIARRAGPSGLREGVTARGWSARCTIAPRHQASSAPRPRRLEDPRAAPAPPLRRRLLLPRRRGG